MPGTPQRVNKALRPQAEVVDFITTTSRKADKVIYELISLDLDNFVTFHGGCLDSSASRLSGSETSSVFLNEESWFMPATKLMRADPRKLCVSLEALMERENIISRMKKGSSLRTGFRSSSQDMEGEEEDGEGLPGSCLIPILYQV